MHNYEDLQAWRRGVRLSATLHVLARASFGADRALWMQITRAAASVPANIAEGAQRGSDREFARFLSFAIASASELHTFLMLAGEAQLLESRRAAELAAEAVALRRMTAALRLRAQGLRPRKPRTSGLE